MEDHRRLLVPMDQVKLIKAPQPNKEPRRNREGRTAEEA